MNTNSKSYSDFNEVLFENKNKQYGAYAMRKSQNDNIRTSLIITLTSFGVLSLWAVWVTNKKIDIPTFDITNDPPVITTSTEIFLIPKEKKIIEPRQKLEAVSPKTTTGQMEASDNKKDVVEGTTEEKTISTSFNPLETGEPTTNDEPVLTNKDTPEEPLVLDPDEMPSLDNMSQFIQNNLKYPDVAHENGTTGTAYISFIVEVDGSLTDVKTARGIGDGCEEEAVRVVKSMPKWKPGRRRGKLVRVKCTLPIHFRLK